MKHAFEDLEVTIAFVEQLKSFESNEVAMQRIVEGNIVNFRQIGNSSLIIYLHAVIFLSTSLSLFHTNKHSSY